jgi:hypothetical protein
VLTVTDNEFQLLKQTRGPLLLIPSVYCQNSKGIRFDIPFSVGIILYPEGTFLLKAGATKHKKIDQVRGSLWSFKLFWYTLKKKGLKNIHQHT